MRHIYFSSEKKFAALIYYWCFFALFLLVAMNLQKLWLMNAMLLHARQ